MNKPRWILEKIGKNLKQYFNVHNPKEHKTVLTALDDPTATFYVANGNDDADEWGSGTIDPTSSMASSMVRRRWSLTRRPRSTVSPASIA